MAKGTTIGFLNFGIDGDNKELLKKIDEIKKEAVSLEKFLSNIKLGVNTKSVSTDIQKAVVNADKLSISHNKVAKSAAEMALAETKAANQVLKDTQNLIYQEERLTGLRKRNSLIGVKGQRDLAAAYGLTNKTMFDQKNLLQQLSSAMGIYFSIYQAGSFVKELAMVSGEFEKQRLSLRAILQDTAAADKIFGQIKDLAVYSPFNFKELTDYAKQLSAFSIPTNEIFDTMNRLADISAGLGVDMNRIILAYGQVRSASVLRGQELRQFTEAGIPLVDELAKKFGELEGRVDASGKTLVTAGEVFDKISSREVPFQMIKDIFVDLTSEGGKFFNMQEIQATSLAGKISNLRDAYDIMLDSIGAANSDLLKGSVTGLVSVMDNWEKYWKILKSIILTYGTYKAVIIAATIAQKGLALAQQITFFINLSKAITGATTATTVFTGATNAMKGALVTNPITAFAVALGGLIGVLTLLSGEVKSTDEILHDLNKSMDAYSVAIATQGSKIDRLVSTYESLNSKTSRNESEQKKLDSTMKELAKTVPSAATGFDEYGKVLGINLDIVSKYNAQQKQFARERLQNQIDATNAEISELQRLVKGYTDVIDNGKAALTGLNQFGTTVTTREALSQSELTDYQNKRADVSDKLTIALGRLSDAEKILNGELLNTNTESKTLSQTVQKINDQINKLNFAEDLKDKIRISDVTKDFESIRQETIKTFDEWNNKVSQMKSAPSLFMPKDIAEAEKMLSLYKEFTNILGGTDKKTGGSSNDSFLDRLKKQADLLKEVRTEYEKLIKAGKTSDESANYLMGFDSFKGIDARNYDQDIQKIISDLQSKGKLSKERQSFLESLILGVDKNKIVKEAERITKEAKDAVDKIEKELSKYKDQYSLYEYIFGKTGDKGQASQIVFGDMSGIAKPYKDILKEAIDSTSDPELKKKLEEQLTGIEWSDRADFTKRMAELVKQYQSVEDQITVIRAKGEASRQEILKNSDNASHEIIEQRLKANQESINKEIADLTNGAIQATDAYQRLFGDIADISEKELNYLINKWKEAISGARKNADGSMSFTIDGQDFTTTEKEVANFTKRILKAEKEVRDRNPFKALSESISDYNKNRDEITKTKNLIDWYTKSLNGATPAEAERINNSIDELIEKLKRLKAEGATSLKMLGSAFSDVAGQVSDIVSSLSSMFDASGYEGASDTLSFIGELGSSIADVGAGIASSNPVQAAQGIIGSLTSIFNFHDKKLDKAIQRSQLEVKKLQNAYESVSRVVSRQLGAITESQAKEQIENLKKQQEELRKQQRAEEKKKKKDKAAIEDYKATISELGDQIAYFYEDLFNELYNFDLKSIADQISSALVDAFKSGEDAALAFDNTVADIINKLATDMISLQVIQPAIEKLRDYLFGSNGVFMDGELSVSDAQGLVAQLAALKGSIGDAKTIWDALNEAANQAGIDLGDMSNSAKDTLSKGIQSVTEDTASLLASYINAMRADLAAQRQFVQQLVTFAQLHTDQFANMYAELLRIQVNTLATANNTAVIAETTAATYDLLRQATVKGSGTAINLA